MFSFLESISERMYKTWWKFSFFPFSFFPLCLCCWGGLFEAYPSGWRPPSLLSCDAGDETWLTNFNKQVPAVGRGVGGWVGSKVRYLFCILYSAGSTWFDPAGLLHLHIGQIKHFQLCLELLRCCSQTFMLLLDDISFPAGINSLKQSPLH